MSMIPTQLANPVQRRIRPVALCVFRSNNRILVSEGYDAQKQEKFYRPLGGGVEFGEYSWDAIRREIREELGEEIQNLTFIGPAENVFEYDGQPGHEIIFVFEAEFVNPALYRQEVIRGTEDDNTPIRAIWKPIADFKRNKAILYPDALLDMLLG